MGWICFLFDQNAYWLCQEIKDPAYWLWFLLECIWAGIELEMSKCGVKIFGGCGHLSGTQSNAKKKKKNA
jgi:hypothetical protein